MVSTTAENDGDHGGGLNVQCSIVGPDRPGLHRFDVLEEIFGMSVPTVFVPFSAGLHAVTASMGRCLSGSGIGASRAARFVSEMFRCDGHSRRPKHDPR